MPGRASWGALGPRRGKGKPAASYSRAGGSRTTLGEEALDFRVRDGNGYCRLSMATGEKGRVAWETSGSFQAASRAEGASASEMKLEKQAKPHVRLVPFRSTPRDACTHGLSRSWSRTGLEDLSIG